MYDMIVNPDKFPAMIMSWDEKESKYDLNINNSIISSVDSVTDLGTTEIDNKLNFEKHVSTIFKKASWQLNEISQIQSYIGKTEKEIIINA